MAFHQLIKLENPSQNHTFKTQFKIKKKNKKKIKKQNMKNNMVKLCQLKKAKTTHSQVSSSVWMVNCSLFLSQLK